MKCLALALCAVSVPALAADLPASVAGRTLTQCVEVLQAQGSGWCDMGVPISTVWPENVEVFRGWGSPHGIATAWVGMAFDRETRRLYFAAHGGHADYLGNEVYEYDLVTGTWTRLTDPCRLNHTFRRGDTEPYGTIRLNENQVTGKIIGPECNAPSSSHTYDGEVFSHKTRTIFWRAGVYGMAPGMWHSKGELWEFNPSRTETRNGLAPLSWKLYKNADGSNFIIGGRGYPVSAELPDGDIIMGGYFDARRFDPADPVGTVSQDKIGTGADTGDGNLIWDAERGFGWFVATYGGLMKLSFGTTKSAGRRAGGSGNGVALRNGNLVFWNGFNFVVEYDPGTGKSLLWDWTGKKPEGGNKNVYSKWVYLPEEDVFVGISRSTVMVYKHPDEGGVETTAVDPQTYIDQAAAGDTVTIPPGLYAKGIEIDRPLTVQMAGAEFIEEVANRAKIWVNHPGGPVVIDGLETSIAPGCASNCAGVRVQGPDYDVTIRNATILNQEMGILTDSQGGGRLVIEDSVIGMIGGGGALSHAVYAGYSDELIIRRSKIHRSDRWGHLVKSRAAVTIIEDSQLLGEDGRHSRIIDVPCGGRLTVRNTTFQQGANTDNADLIIIGGEPESECRQAPTRPSTILFENSTLIGVGEMGPHASFTVLVNWRAPNALVLGKSVILRNTTHRDIKYLGAADGQWIMWP